MKVKKIFFMTLAILCLSLTPVFAQDDIIYITNTNINSIQEINFNVENCLPNDTFSKSILIENNSNKKVKLYLKTLNKEKSDLVKNINVMIIYDNKIICEGIMNDILNDALLLNTINTTEKGNLHIECHIPSSLDNSFNMSSVSLDYILYGMYETENVKTGDNTSYVYLLIPAFVSGLGIVCFAYEHFKEVKQDEKV